MNWFASDLAVILVIIFINSLFVLAEIAILTSRKSKLQKLVAENRIGAAKAIQLKEAPEDFLSTVQMGITLMSIVIGFYSGSALVEQLADVFVKIPLLSEYASQIAGTIIICVITFLTVLGEIIPKRIAMLYPEKCALAISYLMLLFTKIFYPFVKTLSFATKIVLKLLRIKEITAEISAEELKMIISQAENEGTVEKAERDMIRRLIHLSDTKVGAIMTPRTNIIALDLQDSDKDNCQKLLNNAFNSFPVINGSFDQLIGIVYVKDLFNDNLLNNEFNLQRRLQPVVYIPDVARLTQLLELFREKVIRVAIVLDEHGEIEGIVTFNDILKTFIGDMATQNPGETPSIVPLRNSTWIVSGSLTIEAIKELIDISSLPGEDEDDYRTIASFILKQFNQLPQAGDAFDAVGYHFKVIKMDKFRIDRLLIRKIKDSKESKQGNANKV